MLFCVHNKRKRRPGHAPEAGFYFKTRKKAGIIL